MIDSLDYTSESFRTLYSTYYIETVKKAPTLWGWAFERTDIPWKSQRLRQWFERINSQPLVKEILDFKPEIVISTHFVPAAVTSDLIRRGRLDAHSSVVITDFYAHATWLVRSFNRYYVAHEEERVQLGSYGIPQDRISVTGIPIDPKFPALIEETAGAAESTRTIRRELGLDPGLPVVLVTAGAFGVVSVERMLAPLLEVRTDYQLVVICGRNKKLQAKVRAYVEGRDPSTASEDELEGETGYESPENLHGAAHTGAAADALAGPAHAGAAADALAGPAHAGAAAGRSPRITVLGFTREIHRWMAAADLFISKPGGLTTAESTACGLPMILTDPIPGQEVYNAMYLLEHGAAVIPTSPATIGYKVERLLEDPERLERLSRQSGSLGKPRAAFHILEEVLAHRGERAISVQRAVEELA